MLDSATHDLRTALHDVMHETLADEARHFNWTYAPVRPESVPTLHRAYTDGLRIRADCSKGCEFLDWWAGSPSCMGTGFTPYGNSQTICFHLHHLNSAADLWVGDIITFGPWGNEHAARVLERGNDPLLWSHGHQGAPNTYRLSYDARQRQFLRAQIAATPATPQDYLRAMTGWFSWMAWYQGEGPWRHYGKANKTVRPNVPKLIPRSWWLARVKFLANRKNGDGPTTQHLRREDS